MRAKPRDEMICLFIFRNILLSNAMHVAYIAYSV